MLSARRAIFSILTVLFAASAWCQEVHFLAIQGDGTASVILDRQTATAYINDGGRAGSRGIAGARIDGEPVLQYLQRHQITRLVISCSHPHSDHMGGLEPAIKGDSILRFKQLAFVDGIVPGSVDARGKEILRLQDIFISMHGNNVAKEKLIKQLEPAIDADRFAELDLASPSVTVSNYKYKPDLIGSDVHDAAVIVETRVGADAASTKSIVDFDDASSTLIKHWAAERGDVPVNVVVMAHHGSKYNDMSPVLKKLKPGEGDVIFSVNDGNQFLHPSPKALNAAIEAVGVDHVHITRSSEGENVVISPKEVLNQSQDTRKRLESFIDARLARADSVASNRLAAQQTKERAAADKRDLIDIAHKYALNVKITETPVRPRMEFLDRPARLTNSRAHSAASTDAPTSHSPSIGTGRPRSYLPGGSCICQDIVNDVVVASYPIPIGASCGAEICRPDGDR
jgi:hypothetical protein